jgi:hypothetical protein
VDGAQLVGFCASTQAVLVVREQPIGGSGCDRRFMRMTSPDMSMNTPFAD